MQHFDDLGSIWSVIMEYIADKFSPTEIRLWFQDLRLVHLDESRAILLIGSDIKKTVICERFAEPLTQYITDVLGYPIRLEVYSNQFDHFDIKSVLNPDRTEIAEEVKEPEAEPAHTESADPAPARELNSEYTFDNFIVGSSNRFAYAAATAVARNPACAYVSNIPDTTPPPVSYNPLFIYGESGLGKTHLMYAIKNELLRKNPNLTILYVKGEQFTNQLIDSISQKSTNKFREKYRKADVLLIDDIQFIAGKEATQEEFFHTFNALHEDHKQIILSSDRKPSDIKTLEDRLRSRFEWGLIADVQPPDFELRLAIIKNKAQQVGLDIPKEALLYIADNIQSNIRQLEGIIKKLGAMHLLSGTPITYENTQKIVDEIANVKKETDEEKINRIIATVAKKYGITTADIMGTKRSKEIAFPRHISIYIARKTTGLSLPQIGKYFSRDHSTVMSSINTVETEIKRNSNFEFELKELIKEASV